MQRAAPLAISLLFDLSLSSVRQQLGHGDLTGSKAGVAEGIANDELFWNRKPLDFQPLADNDHAATVFLQGVVDVVEDLVDVDLALGQVDLQRQFAVRVGQSRRGWDVANRAAHGLHHQDRVAGQEPLFSSLAIWT